MAIAARVLEINSAASAVNSFGSSLYDLGLFGSGIVSGTVGGTLSGGLIKSHIGFKAAGGLIGGITGSLVATIASSTSKNPFGEGRNQANASVKETQSLIMKKLLF